MQKELLPLLRKSYELTYKCSSTKYYLKLIVLQVYKLTVLELSIGLKINSKNIDYGKHYYRNY